MLLRDSGGNRLKAGHKKQFVKRSQRLTPGGYLVKENPGDQGSPGQALPALGDRFFRKGLVIDVYSPDCIGHKVTLLSLLKFNDYFHRLVPALVDKFVGRRIIAEIEMIGN